MNSEYPRAPIGAVAKVRSGFAFKSTNWQNKGIPVVKIANVKNGRLEMNKCSYVSEDVATIAQDFLLREDDLLISMTGYVGDVAKVKKENIPCMLNQRVGRFYSYRDDVIDPNFLFFHLRHSDIRASIEQKAHGSAQPNISAGSIEEIEIYLPDFGNQKAIAHILSSLDDKIELNRKTNETLEAMAKALFKSWFVDFDPVRAKAEGRPTGLPAEISDLFPDSFEDSELGEIPKGWKITSLDKVADFLNGLVLQEFPAFAGEQTLPVLKIAQLKKRHSVGADKCSANLPPQYKVFDGDILFSWSGSLTVDTWCGGNGALNQHLFKVTSEKYEDWFILHWIKIHLSSFQMIAKSKATTMGHIQRHHLTEAKTLIPPADLLEKIGWIFSSINKKEFCLRVKSRTLAALRDTLLPKLISGELRIPDAEKILEEVDI
ncbi:MAG: restriction endonuclease subunit S [Aphanocapsa feldmannii 277cV]|uniref:Restriction endonuclease subunit S n=1 Tax=Aphanocapsa feldmannii 277cV TaxID=2507553 RepID=A0A524RMS6_9CHRO|nr:MAG: restriction endonuclease subunit S [Aphanocapsa feldmannii 277cV]